MKAKFTIVTIIFCMVCLFSYYYVPRDVPFELVCVIPTKENTCTGCYSYLSTPERMYRFMVHKYNFPPSQWSGFDSSYVDSLSNTLEFDKYDYLFSCHVPITALKHSPHLSSTEDCCDFDKRIPLIPTKGNETEYSYLYRIKKSDKFRAPCP